MYVHTLTHTHTLTHVHTSTHPHIHIRTYMLCLLYTIPPPPCTTGEPDQPCCLHLQHCGDSVQVHHHRPAQINRLLSTLGLHWVFLKTLGNPELVGTSGDVKCVTLWIMLSVVCADLLLGYFPCKDVYRCFVTQWSVVCVVPFGVCMSVHQGVSSPVCQSLLFLLRVWGERPSLKERGGVTLPSCLLFICAGFGGLQQQELCQRVVFWRPLSQHSSLQLTLYYFVQLLE